MYMWLADKQFFYLFIFFIRRYSAASPLTFLSSYEHSFWWWELISVEHFSLYRIPAFLHQISELRQLTSLIKETVRCEMPLCKYIPAIAWRWRSQCKIVSMRSLCGHERTAEPDSYIMQTCNHIYMNCTYPSSSRKDFEDHTRTTWMNHKARKPECVHKEKLHRLCSHTTHIKTHYWSHFFLSFHPFDERVFLLSKWGTTICYSWAN